MGAAIVGGLIGLAGTLIGTGISYYQNQKNEKAAKEANELNAQTQKDINQQNVDTQKEINQANLDEQARIDNLNYERQLETNEWNAKQQQAQNDWNAEQIDKTNQLNINMQRETNATNKELVDKTNTANLLMNAQTNEINRQIAEQNLNFQKQQQEYEENLQQEIFKREDTSYQRTIEDMKAAGLSPLAMSGLNGSGAVVGRTVSNNGYQAQSATMQSASADMTQAQAAQGNAYTGGKYAEAKAVTQQAATRNAWREIAYKNDVDYMQSAAQLNDIVQQVQGNDRAERQMLFNQEMDKKRFEQELIKEDWNMKVDQFNMDNADQKNRIINAALKTLGGKLGVGIKDDGTIGLTDDTQMTKAVTDAKKQLGNIYEEKKKAVEKLKDWDKADKKTRWQKFKSGIKSGWNRFGEKLGKTTR